MRFSRIRLALRWTFSFALLGAYSMLLVHQDVTERGMPRAWAAEPPTSVSQLPLVAPNPFPDVPFALPSDTRSGISWIWALIGRQGAAFPPWVIVHPS